jgi:hypothetical protein
MCIPHRLFSIIFVFDLGVATASVFEYLVYYLVNEADVSVSRMAC